MAITGTVKFFNADKGYGFIAPEDGTADAFVHISAVERAGMTTLNQNQRVTYELEEDRRGKMADLLASYRGYAEKAQSEADAATLDNVRDRCLRAAEAWDRMADRAAHTERLRNSKNASIADPV